MAYPYTSNDPNFITEIYKDLTDPDYWRGFREYWTQPDQAMDEQFFKDNPGLRPPSGTPSIPKQLEKSAQGAQQVMSKAGQQVGSAMMEINPNPYGYNKYLGRFTEGFKSPVENLFGSSLVPEAPKENFFGGEFDISPALKSGEFKPTLSTEDYKMPKTTELIPSGSASTAMQGGVTTPAQNSAQAGKAGSNYIQDAHNAVMDLMKGGSAIPRESEQNINLSAYNRVERDMSGNIIGLSGRVQVNPITGVTEGKIAQDYTATQQSPSNLEAFKARQNPYDSEIQKSVSMASKKYKAKKSAMNGVEYGFDESLTGNPYR